MREALILLTCVLLALGCGWLTVRKSGPEKPVWPVQIYLYLLDSWNLFGVKDYAASRKTFSRREQFLASFFIWFFILFAVAIAAFGCSRKGGC